MPRTLLIAGGLIACAAFFMPWFSACGEVASGAQIAANPERYEMPGEDSSSWVLIWLVLAAGVALVLLGFFATRNVALPGMAASFLGAGLVIFSYVSIEDKSLVEIRYGFWVELVGFATALTGAVLTYSPSRARDAPLQETPDS